MNSENKNNKCLYVKMNRIILELQRRLVEGEIPEKAYHAVLDDFKKKIDEANNI